MMTTSSFMSITHAPSPSTTPRDGWRCGGPRLSARSRAEQDRIGSAERHRELAVEQAQPRFADGEGADDAWIELPSVLCQDLVDSILPGARFAVWAVGGDRVERVGECEDPCADRDRILGEPVGIPGPVPPLVMGADDSEGFAVQ